MPVVKHLEIAVYQGDAYAKAFSGHTGQTISLGGYTADGDDAPTIWKNCSWIPKSP